MGDASSNNTSSKVTGTLTTTGATKSFKASKGTAVSEAIEGSKFTTQEKVVEKIKATENTKKSESTEPSENTKQSKLTDKSKKSEMTETSKNTMESKVAKSKSLGAGVLPDVETSVVKEPRDNKMNENENNKNCASSCKANAKKEEEDNGFCAFYGMQRVCKELNLSSKDIYTMLEPLKTPEDQLKCLFKLFDRVRFEGVYKRGMSDMMATCLRRKGNILFCQGDFITALDYYTMALCFATDQSKEMPMAIGNKSACLYELDQPRAVATHIHVVGNAHLTYPDYPEKSTRKLAERLKNVKNSLVPVGYNERLTDYIQRSYLEGNAWEFHRSAEIIKKAILDYSAMSYETFTGRVATIAYSNNAKANNLSSAVNLEWSEELGRHLVAGRRINAGDVIVRSTMVPALRADPYEFSHCSNCLRFVAQLVPCTFCPDERYCDSTCMFEARVYHWALCRLGSELTFGSKISHTKLMLALRLLCSNLEHYRGKMYDFVKEVSKYEAEAAGNKFKGFNKKGIYDDRDFRTVYFMWSQPELLSPATRQSLAISAAYTMQVITENPGFFETEKNMNKARKTEMKQFLTSVLYRILVGLEWNSYGVFEHIKYVTRQKNSQVKPFVVKTQARSIGLFFNSLLSLFNHACYSNCIFSEQMNGVVIVRAIKPINPGEQLTIPYFDYFTSEYSKADRFAHMGGFQCPCFACTHSLDSKILKCLSELPLSPMCDGCKERKVVPPGLDVVKCRKCKTSIKVHQIRKTLISHQVIMKHFRTQLPVFSGLTELYSMLAYCDTFDEMALPSVCSEVVWLRQNALSYIVAADKCYVRPVLICDPKSTTLLESELFDLPAHAFECER